MQANIGHVVAIRIISIEPPVHHVRDPRQRVPITGIEGGECPLDALRVYPLLHMQVLHNIIAIVELDKIVIPHSLVSKERNHRESHAHSSNPPAIICYGRN